MESKQLFSWAGWTTLRPKWMGPPGVGPLQDFGTKSAIWGVRVSSVSGALTGVWEGQSGPQGKDVC